MSLDDACRRKGLDAQTVLHTLLAIEDDTLDEVDVAGMNLADLCGHIEHTHHAYLKEELPRLGAMVRKVGFFHGFDHPWALAIDGLFSAFAAEMESHMLKEEQADFPMIRALEERGTPAPGGGIEHTNAVLEHEHDDAGEALRRLRELHPTGRGLQHVPRDAGRPVRS